MTIPQREILRGLMGGAGFLAGLIFLDMPWWLAALIGAGVYAGLSLLLPAVAPPPEPDWVGLGISAEDRDKFVQRCRASAEQLKRIGEQLRAGEFGARVLELNGTAASLASYLEKKPERILLAHAVPQNLEHLVKLLQQYLELSLAAARNSNVAETLRKVEETVGNAALALDGMHNQLRNDDVAALKASAQSLEFLLGVDAELERERRKREVENLSALINNNAAGSSASRSRPTEKPL